MSTRVLLALAAFLALAVSAGASEGEFLLLTDFHIDPYYETQFNEDTNCRNETFWWPFASPEDARVPDSFFTHRPSNTEFWESLKPAPAGDWIIPNFNYGQYGCDAPIALVETALDEARRVAPNPDFIIYTGDMSAHDLPTWGTRTLSITDGYTLLAETFPGVPVYPTLGNNDFFPDYFMRPDEILGTNRWLRNVWNIWDSTVGMPADQEDLFVTGGYYSTVAANSTLMVSLNTITLCPCRDPDDDEDGQDDPYGQMAWLGQQLAAAADQGLSVYIIGHIAPTEGDWYGTYLQQYNYLVAQYSDVILAQFFAHNHDDKFYVMWESDSVDPHNEPTGAFVQSPSVTPKDGNNPGFRVVSYDRATFQTLDYWQYYIDLLLCQATSRPEFVLEYQFTTLYRQARYNTAGIYGALQEMARDRQLYNTWLDNKHAQYSGSDDVMDDICSLRENTAAGYERCMLQGLPWILQSAGVTADAADASALAPRLRQGGRWRADERETEEMIKGTLRELARALA